MPFAYCLNASTIKTQPILEQIRVAGEAGYDAIELWHDDIDEYLRTGGQIADLRKALADHGLQIGTTIFLKGWWDTVGTVYQRAMDQIKHRLEQAAALGSPFTIAGPPLGLVDLRVGVQRYRRLLELGEEFGVKPVFEYLGFAAEVNSIDVARHVINQCGRPDATLVLDPFHCFRGGGGCEAIAKLRQDQVAISHFNDAPSFPPRPLQLDPDRV
ncbi:MAG TPA: sugar phosphate isomerase/epimerase, partial [Planctomycetaceae bacterium]|nr:sugar phosphate isomerase/epimerase [Planctomycetaceae bacterium]